MSKKAKTSHKSAFHNDLEKEKRGGPRKSVITIVRFQLFKCPAFPQVALI